MLMVTASLLILFASNTNEVFAEQSGAFDPKITVADVYIESKIPIQVPFKVTASDMFNNPIPVECDKTQNSVFKIGKTTVRCIAKDALGNEIRSSFVVTVGYEIVQIPNWLKQTTHFWTNDKMSDYEYLHTLNFLFEKQIIHVPHVKASKNNMDFNIPVWIKINAEKWTKGKYQTMSSPLGYNRCWTMD